MFGQQAKIYAEVIDALNLGTDDRVLDVGCGTGVVTRAITDRLLKMGNGIVMGIDAAGKMIWGAREKRGTDNCRFETAAAEDLPFDDESFDSVVSTLFFHHIQLDLKEIAFKEIFRVLKPGGRLVVCDMHIPETIFGWLVAHTSRWILFQPQIGENIRGELPGVIEQAGFFPPVLEKTYLGYISLFTTSKP